MFFNVISDDDQAAAHHDDGRKDGRDERQYQKQPAEGEKQSKCAGECHAYNKSF